MAEEEIHMFRKVHITEDGWIDSFCLDLREHLMSSEFDTVFLNSRNLRRFLELWKTSVEDAF